MAAAAARWAGRTPVPCPRPLGSGLGPLLPPWGPAHQRRQRLHGAPADPASRYLREYFYYVDQHGQLFLEETKIRNFTTCFKDVRFLDLFFSRLRPNDTGRLADRYPFVSPCGREMNYVAVEDVPVVFKTLTADGRHFVWGGTLQYPFDPHQLYFGARGRLYHPSPVGPRALVRSALALELLKDAVPTSANDGTLTMAWRGEAIRIPAPVDANAGSSSGVADGD